jgi:hypothetical protein
MLLQINPLQINFWIPYPFSSCHGRDTEFSIDGQMALSG